MTKKHPKSCFLRSHQAYLDVLRRKLGSIVRINGLFHLHINVFFCWGYNPLTNHLLTSNGTSKDTWKTYDATRGESPSPMGNIVRTRLIGDQISSAHLRIVRGSMLSMPCPQWLVYLEDHPRTCKWTPIYEPFRPFGRGTTLLRGFTNHGY